MGLVFKGDLAVNLPICIRSWALALGAEARVTSPAEAVERAKAAVTQISASFDLTVSDRNLMGSVSSMR